MRRQHSDSVNLESITVSVNLAISSAAQNLLADVPDLTQANVIFLEFDIYAQISCQSQ